MTNTLSRYPNVQSNPLATSGSLIRVIRKFTKRLGSFPTDDAAIKLIYLAIQSLERTGQSVREWVAARHQFAIFSRERFNE